MLPLAFISLDLLSDFLSARYKILCAFHVVVTEKMIFFQRSVKILYFQSQFGRYRTIVSFLHVVARDELGDSDDKLKQRRDNISLCSFLKISDSQYQRLALIILFLLIEIHKVFILTLRLQPPEYCFSGVILAETA